MKLEANIQNGYEKAKEVLKKAHAPYSKFRVGAALKLKGSDEIFSGCNVENASFGATICAEKNALCQSVGLSGKGFVEWIVIVAETENPTPPCGMCLQTLSEFKDGDFDVYLANPQKVLVKKTFNELFPYQFETFKI